MVTGCRCDEKESPVLPEDLSTLGLFCGTSLLGCSGLDLLDAVLGVSVIITQIPTKEANVLISNIS